VLSVGLGIEKLNKIPKPMTCMQKIFYYWLFFMSFYIKFLLFFDTIVLT
jgi:hypothetical protein